MDDENNKNMHECQALKIHNCHQNTIRKKLTIKATIYIMHCIAAAALFKVWNKYFKIPLS